MLQIELKDAYSSSFELEGSVEVPWTSEGSERFKLRVPLPLLPQAVQQDAALLLDERLALNSEDDISIQNPAGYFNRGIDRGLQFRYDPVRVTSVELKPCEYRSATAAWGNTSLTRSRYFRDGHMEAEWQAELRVFQQAVIDLQLPAECNVRQVRWNGNRSPITVAWMKTVC